MYVPERFALVDPRQINAFLKQNSLGVLITEHGGLTANHVPCVYVAGEQCIYMHPARSNPQAKRKMSQDKSPEDRLGVARALDDLNAGSSVARLLREPS